MSTRVLGRFAQGIPPRVDLPTLSRPQIVDEHGYELNDEQIAALAEATSTEAAVEEDQLQDVDDNEVEEVEEDEENLVDNVPMAGDEGGEGIAPDDPDNEISQDGTPLLSIAESLILHYSLIQTRHHHLQHLLPLMFSHPAIPAHNRPRIRAPPKTGFVFPTPPPPVPPLPSREYHGPSMSKSTDKPNAPAPETSVTAGSSQATSSSAPIPSTSSSHPPSDIPALASATSTSVPVPTIKGDVQIGTPEQPQKKTSKKRGQPPADGSSSSVPAHEIECLARVTLQVGPMSYPNAELWVGRFVEPRTGVLTGTVRGKSKTGLSGGPALKPKVKPVKRPPAPSGPSRQPVRPPAVAIPPPQAPNSYASRSEIPQTLIQRVNAAATQFPWLSILIHKAARNVASKDELAKLGRVVARLGRGEGVGEGPEMPGLQPAGPSKASVVPSVSVRPPSRPLAGPSKSAADLKTSASTISAAPTPASNTAHVSNPLPVAVSAPAPVVQTSFDSDSELSDIPSSSTPATRPVVDEDSDSDLSDIDMTGPPQEGGGPVPATTNSKPSPSQASAPHPASPQSTTSTIVLPKPLSTVQMPTVVPTLSSTVAQSSPSVEVMTAPASISTSSHNSNQLSLTAPGEPISSRPPTYSTNPVPSGPKYPLPPPFLLIAFRESPTDKFLIPLGARSFISRVGGDYVTDPIPPLSPSPPPPPSAPPASDPPEAEVKQPETTPTAVPVVESKVRKTRASLAAAKPIPPPSAPRAPTPEPITEPTPPPSPPSPKKDPFAGLPVVPGMNPTPGTVLISTFTPEMPWLRPQWDELAKRLPFSNSSFVEKIMPPSLKTEQSINPDSAMADTTSNAVPSPKRSIRVTRAAPEIEAQELRQWILNLGAESFLPAESALQPITIRLVDVNDGVWRRVKNVINEVERTELEALAHAEPELLRPSTTTQTGTQTASHSVTASSLNAVRDVWLERKRAQFQKLLGRAAPRVFPRFRVEGPPNSTLVEVTSDKWAPRPYHMTTRPLYARTTPEPEAGDENTTLPPSILEDEPVAIPRKGRKPIDQPAVTFEMPVSLDALDERVEAGAARGFGRGRGRGRGGRGGAPPRAKKYVRGSAGAICQGCGKVGIKVWRRGPNGKSTLCNNCGDKFLAGTLGELMAPPREATSETPMVSEAEDEAADSNVDENIKVEAHDTVLKEDQLDAAEDVKTDGESQAGLNSTTASAPSPSERLDAEAVEEVPTETEPKADKMDVDGDQEVHD